MPNVTVYGLVAKCPRALSSPDIERVISGFGRAMFPGASIFVDEASDRGSLVSTQRETFRYVLVTDRERQFSFCRFRQFEGGVELAFNLSDSKQTPDAIDQYLTAAISIEVVRREFL